MESLVCYTCGKKYDINSEIFRCTCGGYLNVESTKSIDLRSLNDKHHSLWRYRDFIPVYDDEAITSFSEGFTPFVREKIYGMDVLLKLDYLFPSGSYKDRGSTVLISKIKELNISHIIEDSSGNAGASIAMYAAKAGIKADIYVPESTVEAKLVQIKATGASLKVIKGDRENTAETVLRMAKEIYYASHVYNPFFYEGTKTFGFEIAEQFEFNLPDVLMLPIGNGTLFIGAYKGLQELLNSGYINKMPRFVGVQAKNCAPIYNSLHRSDLNYSETLAEGIAIKKPLRIKQITDIIRKTDGKVITVTESDIKEALLLMLKNGFYIEPTSAATVAGLKYCKHRKQKILLSLTGSGLKSNEKIAKIMKTLHI